MSVLTESEKLKRAIQKVVREEIKAQTKDCLRIYKATVSTIAADGIIGVKLVANSTELTLPCSTSAASLALDAVAWVQTTANNFRNASVISTADLLRQTT